MANARYDHTGVLMSGSDWVGARILAYLFAGATFDSTNKLLSEVQVAGVEQRNVTTIDNRSVGPNGEMMGIPAMFSVTAKGSPYQVVLTWDQGLVDDQYVLAYYDQDEVGDPLGLQNNGTLIVRPTDYDPATGVGTWFSL